jgi:hypothetical protein
VLNNSTGFTETFTSQNEVHMIKDGVRICYDILKDHCYVSKCFAVDVCTLKSRVFNVNSIEDILEEHLKFTTLKLCK